MMKRLNMGRNWAAALLLAGAVFLTAGCGQTGDASAAENKQPPDVTIEQIIQANRTENLLKNHSNFLLETQEKAELQQDYMDENGCYTEKGEDSVLTTPDGAKSGFYDGNYYSDLYAGVKPDMSYLDYLSIAAETAYEQITDTALEDGKLLVTTKMEGAVYQALNEYEAQDGDYLKVLYTMDPDTFEISHMEESICYADGSEEQTKVIQITYDTAQPAGEADLLKHFAQEGDKRTVTMILDPGTQQETTYSIRLPKGDGVYLDLPAFYPNRYTDAACTQQYEGGSDPSADLTLYSKAEFTMADLLQANTADQALESYRSFQVNVDKPLNAEGDDGSFSYYVDSKLLYYTDANKKEMESIDGARYGEFSGTIGKGLYIGTEEEPYERDYVLLGENSIYETIESTKLSDGQMIITTTAAGEALEKIDPSLLLKYSKIMCIYTVDALTGVLRTLETHYFDLSGTETADQATVTTNVMRPELAQTLYEHAHETQDLKTTTVVLDAGTDHEETASVTRKNGDQAMVFFGENCDTTFYLDPECTKEYQPGDATSNNQVFYIHSIAQ